jgi:ADP-ribose pyrophosphatase YjhB (NUDIX family)
MKGRGPYLWINKYAPPAGFHQVPPGGMCIGVFLFVRRGRRILLGKVREHPAWAELAGETPSRMRGDAGGWKVPARQLRLGEDPRDAARQIGEEMLGLKGLHYGEPRVEVEFWKLGAQASGPPERRKLFHFDMWLLVDATLKSSHEVARPAWFEELAWKDPRTMSKKGWARFHGDVVARWKGPRRRTPLR